MFWNIPSYVLFLLSEGGKMCKKLTKIMLMVLFLFVANMTLVYAGENDTNIVRNYYDGYYAVYDAPDRVRLFYAERLTMNGDTAYCIQPGIGITGYTYSSTEDWSMANLSSDVVEYIRLVAYYGYDYPNHQTMRYYFAAQDSKDYAVALTEESLLKADSVIANARNKMEVTIQALCGTEEGLTKSFSTISGLDSIQPVDENGNKIDWNATIYSTSKCVNNE